MVAQHTPGKQLEPERTGEREAGKGSEGLITHPGQSSLSSLTAGNGGAGVSANVNNSWMDGAKGRP